MSITYLGSHLTDQFGDDLYYINYHKSDTRFCMHNDKGLCELKGCKCEIYGLCPNYKTRRGQKVEKENAIRVGVKQTIEKMHEDNKLKKNEFKKKLKYLDLKIGCKIKHNNFGYGTIVYNGTVKLNQSNRKKQACVI